MRYHLGTQAPRSNPEVIFGRILPFRRTVRRGSVSERQHHRQVPFEVAVFMSLRRSMRMLSLLTLTWMASPFAGAQAESYSPRVGQPHPDFVLPSITDGRSVALSQFRGRKVLLIHLACW